MTLALLYVLAAFATARVTRLVAADDFPPIRVGRNWLVAQFPDRTAHRAAGRGSHREAYWVHWWLGELITCVWCASGWISLAVVGLVWHWHTLPLPLLWWPAVWGAGAILAARLG